MNTMKKLLLLALCLFGAGTAFAAWSGNAATSAPATQTINEKVYYKIATPEDLAWFAAQVNGGSTGINGILTADLYFGKDDGDILASGNKNWTPIGSSSGNAFAGVLDGAGHTIYGLYWNGTDLDAMGVVGYLGTSGKVTNLTVANASFVETEHSQNAPKKAKIGAIVAQNNGGTVEKCNALNVNFVAQVKEGAIQGSVVKTDGWATINNVGGVVGWNKSGTVSQSYSTGSVTGYYVGGVVGRNSTDGTVSNCISKAEVHVKSSNNSVVSNTSGYGGGVVGRNFGTMEYCVYTGSVVEKSVGKTAHLGAVSGGNGGDVVSDESIEESGSESGTACSESGKCKVENSYYTGSGDLSALGESGEGASAQDNVKIDGTTVTNETVIEALNNNVCGGECAEGEGFVVGENGPTTASGEKAEDDAGSVAEGKVNVRLSVNDENMGTVSGAGAYTRGGSVSVSATPKTGYRFVSWSDATLCPAASCSFTVNNHTELTATFEVITHTIILYLPNGSKTTRTFSEGTELVLPTSGDDLAIEGWTLAGWFTSTDYANASQITSIPASNVGEVDLYGKYTQSLAYEYGTAPNAISGSVTIYYGESDEEIASAIAADLAGSEPPVVPTKAENETYTYAYAGSWSKNATSGKFEPNFTANPKSFTVTLTLPAGASLVSELESYTYGVETSLPDATLDGWTFKRWEDGAGNTVTAIGATEYGDKTYTAVFTKTIQVVIGETTLDVDITLGDDDAAIQAKITDAMNAHNPKIDTPTKEQSDTHTYAFDKFVAGEDGKYVASFDSTAREFSVTLTLPAGASLVSELESYTYGTGATLPNATLDGWTFKRWEDGAGNTVTAIGATEYGNKSYTAVFTKNIQVVIGETTLGVEIENDDTDAEIQTKIAAAMNAHDPKIDTPTKEQSDTHTYAFDKFVAGADGKYVASFDSTAREFTVTLTLPAGASLVSQLDSYTYGAGATLPNATLDGWTFKRWEDGAGNTVTAIGATEYGDKTYTAVFTKTIQVVIGETTLDVDIALGDDDAAIQAKITDAMNAHNPKIDTPTKEQSDTHTYTFDKFVAGADGKYVASFDSTARDFTVTLNLPTGAALVTPLANYTYGEGATLPDATLAGWTFSRWEDGAGNTVTAIAADAYGNKSYTAVFTKTIQVVIGETTLGVEIENDDTDAEIQTKIAAAMDAHDPKIDTPTKEQSDTHTYAFDKFVAGEDGKYVASFDSTAREFSVTLTLPAGASLVSELDSYTYGTGATLPNATLAGWTFKHWEDGAGNTVTAIGTTEYGNKTYTAVFTKTIQVVIGETTLDVEIENDDTDAEIQTKITDAMNAHDPKIDTPTKEQSDTHTYTFDKFVAGADGKYVPSFDSTAREFSVTLTLPAGASLVSELESYTYGTGATLPNATLDGWTFKRWEDGAGNTVTAIAADAYGNKTYTAVFTKNIQVVIGETTLDVEIENDDTDAEIQAKIAAAMNAHDPKIDTPTKEQSDTHTYTFDKFVAGADGKYVASFDSTAREFSVTLTLPAGASLVSQLDSYTYGVETSLPDATLDGWTFKRWEDGEGNTVTAIAADAYGNKTYSAVFTKTIQVVIGETTLDVEIALGDDDAAIQTKIADAMNAHNPKIDTPTKEQSDTHTYAFNKFVAGEDGKYVASFDSTAREFSVTLTLPAGASLVSELESYTYGTGATLPNATLDGWTFKRWEDGAGNTVTAIAADAYGNKTYTAVFTKTIQVVIGETTLDVAIESGDTDAQIQTKITDAMNAHDPKIDTPTKEQSDTHTYTFDKFVAGADGKYVASFDSTAREFSVTLTLPAGASLVSQLDSYTYGVETSLPDATLDGWTFKRWEDGEGNTVTAIAADAYGNKTYTAVFTKTIQVVIGETTLDVEIALGDDDAAIQTKIAAAMNAHDPKIDTPTKEQSDTHTYTFDKFVAGVDGKYVPTFTSAAREFTVTLNLPAGASLVSQLDSYTYGTGATLPNATLDGWTFKRWEDGAGNTVTAIGTTEYGNKTYTAVFTKTIQVVIGETTLDVAIESGDTDAQIQTKITAAMNAHDPKIDTPTKEQSDTHTYAFDKFIAGADGKYVASFDSTERVFSYVVVAVGDGEKDTIVIKLEGDVDESTINQKIEETLVDKNIEVPTKESDSTYDYNFDKWEKNEITGKYEAKFKAYVKTKNIKVIYGDGKNDYVYVAVLMTDSAEVIQDRINAYVKSGAITVVKNSDDDFNYVHSGWVYNESLDAYVASYSASPKARKARVYYGQGRNDFEVMEVYVTDTGAEIEKKIAKALGGKTPTKDSTSKYAYTFSSWAKDVINGIIVYTPEFDSTYIGKKEDPVEDPKKDDAIAAKVSVQKFMIVVSDRALEVSGVRAGTKIEVFDLNGHKVSASVATSHTLRIELTQSGSYVVRAGYHVQRVIVK